MKYIPFNVKTDYLLLSSLIKLDDLISFCVSHKLDRCAICDDNLGASLEFYNKCISNNIKPVIGLFVNYGDYELYLYAENYDGYKNLLKINTFKESGSIDENILIKYSNNVLCVIPYEARELFNKFSCWNNTFIGYKNNEEKVNSLLLTSNVVYNVNIKMFRKEDKVYLEYLNKLGGFNNLLEKNYISEVSLEESLEYDNLFGKINLVFEFGEKYIPVFNKDKNSDEYLSRLANVGLLKRLNNECSDEYKKRLDYELSVIKEMGFTDYFLIVYDYVLYAKKNKILVGPGRGSAAGSLVCYATGITDIDPIKYNLLFERFLNKDRVTMPDIDIDFDSNKRDEIISYVRGKYGYKNVAVGLTYNTYKAKLILREVAKLFNVDSSLFEKFIKLVDRSKSLRDNLDNKFLKKYLDTYDELKNIYKVSIRLENLKKNVSTHAAGVVICSEELDNIIPIRASGDNYTTGITMDYLEDLGILKMDFLGLKNLSLISSILEKHDENILKNMSLTDEKVIDVFKKVYTDGIFQYETVPMKRLLRKLKPDSFDEIVAAVALVRPGPSDFLDEYINNKENPGGIKYISNDVKEILSETYGIILYQEQIIRLMTVVGGFSASSADLIRRAISKKKDGVLNASAEKFINGALAKGYSADDATDLFNKIVKFAGYGFNKSHSVAYALIAYQMAYLKVYYQMDFVNAILNESKDINMAENYLVELKNKGVKVIKPDINYSKDIFYVYNKQLILPFTMIKGLSKEIICDIINNAPYNDFFDFVLKNKSMKKEHLELLIKAGAMRSLKTNINTLLKNIDVAKNYAELNGLGSKPILTSEEELDYKQLLQNELEIFGFYVGNHPSSKYQDKSIMKLKSVEDNLFKNVSLVVVIENIKKIKTKKNTDMAFVNVSDETKKDDIIVFSECINELDDLNKGDIVRVSGKVSKSFDKVSLIVSKIVKESSR